MNFEIIFVLLGLIGMLVALILDKMRPGIVLAGRPHTGQDAPRHSSVVIGSDIHGGRHYNSETNGSRIQQPGYDYRRIAFPCQ